LADGKPVRVTTIGRLIMAQAAGEAAWGAALVTDSIDPFRVIVVVGAIVAAFVWLGWRVTQGRARAWAIATEIVTVFGGARILHGPGEIATVTTTALGAAALAGLLLAEKRTAIDQSEE
jgi:hypothetical protein